MKVEFALETARVRLHLPFKGETWFFVDSKTTLKDFTERCLEEDALVKDLRILDERQQEFRNQEAVSLYSLLTIDKQQVYVKINDNLHAFPRVQARETHLGDSQWFGQCQSGGLSATHASTLATFIA